MSVTTVILIAICVLLTLAMVVLFATVAELSAQVRQLRLHLKLDDAPTELDRRGFIQETPELLRAEGLNGLVVLSTSCQSCHQIARGLDVRSLAANGFGLLIAGSEELEQRFVEEYRLAYPTTFLNTQTDLADQVGIDTSPAVITYSTADHLMTSAWAVGSRRELDKIITKEVQDARNHGSTVIHR